MVEDEAVEKFWNTPELAEKVLPCLSARDILNLVRVGLLNVKQSVTSRLETSRYRDFSQLFESIGLGLEIFDLEKKSRYRSRKYLVSKKSLGIGLENI